MSLNNIEEERRKALLKWTIETKEWRTLQNYIQQFNRGKLPSLKMVEIYGFHKKPDGKWDVSDTVKKLYDIPKPAILLTDDTTEEDSEIEKRKAREAYEMERRPWKNIISYLRLFNRGVKTPSEKMTKQYAFFQKEDGTWDVPQSIREQYDIPLPKILQDEPKIKTACEEHDEMIAKRKEKNCESTKKRYQKQKSFLKAQSYVAQINKTCRKPCETTIRKYDLKQDEYGKWFMSNEMIDLLKCV